MGEKQTATSILVVDDDEDVAKLLEFMLTREGFEVHVAKDGNAAVKTIDKMTPPGVVVLDIMLPYLSGLQVLKHIRGKEEWLDSSIIMLSSKTDERGIGDYMEAGATDYMTKPFNWDELITRIKDLAK